MTTEFATKEEAWRAASEIVSGLKSSHHEMRSLFRDLTFAEEDEFIDEFIEKVERRLGKKIVGGVRTFIERETRDHYS
ncbi:hypothetical protein [Pseudomonas sp. PS02303]|jgi:hypothetical protein|uniref:hypothetical protein n=1 Tax=Pseudomonas sp. PS02303 TaxID=2991429 RepID=UPI00249B797D|nr:hypothetical protein [Pseudomonas sp. PS02303]